ncbi:Uncharacterised protein [Vibrio cholerae]|nr:Uncharacterised protein [Vibrio cholerae]
MRQTNFVPTGVVMLKVSSLLCSTMASASVLLMVDTVLLRGVSVWPSLLSIFSAGREFI